MKLTDFCEMLDLQINISYYPQQGTRWACPCADVVICDGGMLVSAYEDGKTSEEALKNYSQRLSGKKVKINNATYLVVPKLED